MRRDVEQSALGPSSTAAEKAGDAALAAYKKAIASGLPAKVAKAAAATAGQAAGTGQSAKEAEEAAKMEETKKCETKMHGRNKSICGTSQAGAWIHF